MTRHQSSSTDNYGSDQGTHRLKAAEQLALDDAARSAWLDAAIRTPAKSLARNTGRVHGRTGGRRAAARPRPRSTWTCGNCGARGKGAWCLGCKTVRGT